MEYAQLAVFTFIVFVAVGSVSILWERHNKKK